MIILLKGYYLISFDLSKVQLYPDELHDIFNLNIKIST